MTKWLEGNEAESDIVISSRIRLARNIEHINFPQMISDSQAQDIVHQINNAVINSNTVLSRDFTLNKVDKIAPIDRKILVEKHIISPSLIEHPSRSAFLLRNDEKVTIMINEEDHIRIQVLLPGLNLEAGWDLCSKIDDVLEENIKYAFDEQFGYLTSCPTNVGTGLRASVMIHLPGLVLTGYINKVLQAVSQIGITVRGLYGEGTEAMGNIFQISNQTTLGETEEEIIQKLRNVVLQIMYKERESREKLLSGSKTEVEDRIYRSLGLLQNARIMTSKESMKLLSDVRMGVEMGIIKDIKPREINQLMIITQPANIQKYAHSDLTTQERDIKRADLIREKLKV